MLGRIRAALGDVPPGEAPGDVPVTRDYRRVGELGAAERLSRFAERVRDYNAEVVVTDSAGLPAALDDACAAMGLARVAVPAELPEAWRPAAAEIIEDHGLSAADLDALDGAVTGCASAIADTGTLVLDGRGASGRRLITLVPDHHVCIISAEQIVELVPEAIAALAPAVHDGGAPVTFVSGPSASSDIELSRVEGVHGPRHLRVLIVDDPVAGDRSSVRPERSSGTSR
jgi:L-lactate dehydrogenase complex protein LldG